jgi:RNA polymerase sigma-70 factor (ECF subfamily)
VALRAEEIQDSGTVDLDRDRALVVRYQRGDESAFDELYRRYYPRLHLYCVRRVHDPHVSEELAQEAFIRAIKAMPRFAGDRRFYPWMTVIAQRLCIDHHRRTGRVEVSDDVDPGIVEEHHEALFAAVDHGHLEQAMEKLAPRHREVLDLREQRGWSYHQIAEHLDVPVTTVEALLHRARKALKREFLAVSGGSRLAGFPLVGWVMFRIARVRAKVSGYHADQLVPIAGSAVAGVAAIGLVLNPFGPAPSMPTLSRPPAVVASPAVHSTPAPVVPSLAVPPAEPSPAAAPDHPRATPPVAPPPVATAGPVGVYSGPTGVEQAQQANAEQPVQVDLGIVQIGVNPVQTVTDATDNLSGGLP